MSIEALKLALEALEDWNFPLDDKPDREIMNTLSQAIAEAEKQTFTYAQMKEQVEGLQRDYDLLLAEYNLLKQEQGKPVIDKSAAIRIATALGWTPPKQDQGEPVVRWDSDGWGDLLVDNLPDGALLYTTPQRTWVGLTDEEIDKTVKTYWGEMKGGPLVTNREYVRVIEAKLRSKNERL